MGRPDTTARSFADPAVQHRIGNLTLTVHGADGRPLDDQVVTVEQQRHAFSFGNIAFELVGLVGGPEPLEAHELASFGARSSQQLDRLGSQWLGLFNTATLPFYWGAYEPRLGHPDVGRLTLAAQWLADRGITVKGHPLVWHVVQPTWLVNRSLDEVERLLRERIRSVVGEFAGLVNIWDAINEAVVMPVAKAENAITPLAWDRGRIFLVRLACEEARAANPSATLVLNDFDLSTGYECLIEGVLEAGIEIDAIGLQTHMHRGYRGEEFMARMLDRFARFGLPLHMTESTILSGQLIPADVQDFNDFETSDWPTTPEGESRQADEIRRHYRSLVSHPAVQAINYWGMSDEGSWLGAPVGLVRKDGSLKPSYLALESLIKGEWWLPRTSMRTDAEGRVQVRGFFGDYRVIVGDDELSFAVTPDVTEATVRLG
jgi:endo-1,4-beta-xylanase